MKRSGVRRERYQEGKLEGAGEASRPGLTHVKTFQGKQEVLSESCHCEGHTCQSGCQVTAFWWKKVTNPATSGADSEKIFKSCPKIGQCR